MYTKRPSSSLLQPPCASLGAQHVDVIVIVVVLTIEVVSIRSGENGAPGEELVSRKGLNEHVKLQALRHTRQKQSRTPRKIVVLGLRVARTAARHGPFPFTMTVRMQTATENMSRASKSKPWPTIAGSMSDASLYVQMLRTA